jgi:glutamate/aspartate transport system substrate-binding protein
VNILNRIAAGTLACLSIVGAHAQTLDKIKKDGAITLGYRDSAAPFSYLDDKQQPIGYSMDICMKIVDAVKSELKMPALKVNLNAVGPATRIPLIANGTIDLECGVTTNNAERQKQVAFAPTTFVTATRLMHKKSLSVEALGDLKGKALASPSGSSNMRRVTELNTTQQLGINLAGVQDLPEAFLMVETGRAAALATDDVIIYNMIANAKAPGDYAVSKFALSIEPYGIMLGRGDPAFKKVVDDAVVALFKSGEIDKLYAKWFTSPVPPKGINMNMPMSPALKRAIAKPTDSPEPKDYE